MKKLMYLFVAAIMVAFMACGGGENSADPFAEEVVVACANDCQKACCLGCHAIEGDAVCLADHSCCAHHHEDDSDEATEDATEGATEETAE